MAFRAIRERLEELQRAESHRAPTAAVQRRPRTALGDIGNHFASPRKRGVTKPVDAPYRSAPERRRRAASKEQKVPPPSPEPQELEPHYTTSVENHGWHLSEDMLCQDLSEMFLDVKGKHEDDDEPDFSSCYKNLRNLRIKVNYS